jgi:hypothetical protein
MEKELVEEIKKLIKEKIEIKFGNISYEGDILIIEVKVFFQKEMIELVTVSRERYSNYSAIIDEKGNIVLSGFEKIEKFFTNILFRNNVIEKLIQLEKIASSYSFIIPITEILIEAFKQTKIYKMHCLYDKGIEKILDGGE